MSTASSANVNIQQSPALGDSRRVAQKSFVCHSRTDIGIRYFQQCNWFDRVGPGAPTRALRHNLQLARSCRRVQYLLM